MTTTTDYIVTGMTCAHCVAAVTGELTALDGVQAVSIELVADGESTVTVRSTGPLPETAVRMAVDEAGYVLQGARA
ncbi:heavy-metal-associated domain-containing protein [Pengzhenrongella phosphoraccumulans]|uniref:heavy-metal-associated domain-containing protein n=1 Tax=Pengzhenrongella phosphoraccumulans TaxID=3114394 RepID=UPI00388DFBFB